MSRIISRPPKWDASHESSASSAYSHSTAKESHAVSGRGSKDEASSTTGNMSEHKGDGGSAGEGSGGDDLESEGPNPKGSGSKCWESCTENEETGSGSGSGSSASESKDEIPKAKLNKPPPKASLEVNPNASQTPLLPELDDKDFEDELKSYCHDLTHFQDVDFGKWRDCMISEGQEEWVKQDKMICNHADPHKRVKHPDLLGVSITYMESKDAFKPIKTSEYNLCCFYQVGTIGEFPPFPAPREPAMNNDV